MSKSDFDKNGLDQIGIHWGQYLALTFTSFFIFLICLYRTIPGFRNFVLDIIWFINCSGFNCNGAWNIKFILNKLFRLDFEFQGLSNIKFS